MEAPIFNSVKALTSSWPMSHHHKSLFSQEMGIRVIGHLRSLGNISGFELHSHWSLDQCHSVIGISQNILSWPPKGFRGLLTSSLLTPLPASLTSYVPATLVLPVAVGTLGMSYCRICMLLWLDILLLGFRWFCSLLPFSTPKYHFPSEACSGHTI